MLDRLVSRTDDRIAAFLFPLIIRAAVDRETGEEVARRLGFDLLSMQGRHHFIGGPSGPRSMWGELVRITGDEMIGWRAAGAVDLSAFGPFYALLRSSRNLGLALQMVLKFADTLDTTRHPQLRVEGDKCIFQWRSASVATFQQDTDFRLYIGHRILADLVPGFRLSTVMTPHVPSPSVRQEYESEYRRVFGCEVEFGAELPTLVFDSSMLELPLASADSVLHDVARGQMSTMLPHRPSDDFRKQLEAAYRNAIETGQCELSDVASRIDLTPCVFRTRLRGLGTNHREQCQRARIQLAESLLKNPGLTMASIGTQLGYNSATAFAKAFRRWTGSSPSAFRRSISH